MSEDDKLKSRVLVEFTEESHPELYALLVQAEQESEAGMAEPWP